MTEPLVVLHSSRRWLKQTKTWIFHQLKWLPESVEAHVVCDATENLDQFPCPHLHTLERAPVWRRKLESGLRRGHLHPLRFPVRVAKRIGARVLHSHFGPEGFRELPIARAAGLKHVVTFYGYDVTRLPAASPVWRERYRELFRRVDLVLCEGPHMRAELVKLGCPEHKARVQHLGADLTKIDFRPRRWTPGQVLRLLIAGSFREKKGFPYAIRALGILRQRQPELNFEVAVIGDAGKVPGEQTEKREIERAIAESGLQDRVHLLGYRSYAQLLDEAYRCHVYLAPSVRANDGDTEGGAPVTIVELAASGMPIISTTHCDIPNVLRGKAASFLAPERDVHALAERMVSLFAAPSEWSALVQDTRSDIERRFDAEGLGKELGRIYAGLVQ
jgi:colanic acid/amylovoran biosynthesis glycosyltransferase